MSDAICSVSDCDRPARSIGLCKSHYSRKWRTGLSDATPLRHYARRGCSVDGCERRHHGLGLCSMHYSRMKQFGDVHRAKQMPSRESHWNWAGEGVDYIALHKRVGRERGPARQHACVHCGQSADQWAYDHGDPEEKIAQSGRVKGLRYSLKTAHYIALCALCHRRFDLAAASVASVTSGQEAS